MEPRDEHHPDHADRDPAGHPDLPDAVDAGTSATGAPFGLPVLAEVPELTGVLERLVAVDRLLAEVVDTLVLLADSGQVEQVTGVAVDGWLSIVARRTGSDVRMLRCALRVCRRLPSLHTAFRDGRISWAQTRAVTLRCDRVPQVSDLALDARVADAVDTCRDAEPDALARMVGWAIADLTDPPEEQPAPAVGDGFLHLQPRLDGSGGRLYGELDAYSFALLDAATAPRSYDGLGPTRDGFAGPPDPDQAAHATRSLGRQRLARLLTHLALPSEGPAGIDAPTVDGVGEEVPLAGCKLLLRAELDTLLGRAHLPSQLLTTLAGGAMQLDAATARRLADAGVTLRTIVTDQGQVVGVGRQTRVPPGWLRDATMALHDTCTAPGCDRAALSCQTDHAIGWEQGGHTDIGNCAPLCGHDNRHKETAGWHATGRPDGTRRWHHPRSGLQTSTYPASSRPPPTGRGNSGREPPRHPPPDQPPDR